MPAAVILGGVVLTNLYPVVDRFDVRGRARLDLERLAEALRVRAVQVGALPDPSEVPSALVEPGKGGEPSALDPDILENGRFLDPWGTPYVYTVVGSDAFELRSYGRDRWPDGDGADADVVLRCLLLSVPAGTRPSERR